jgi:O-antigen/teichoic acid export membrane protein
MKLPKLGVNLVLQLIIKFGAVLITIFTTRWLISNVSSSDLADYNVGIAYVSIITSLINGGIPNVIQKFYTNHHKLADIKPFWSTFVAIRFATYFIGLGIIYSTYQFSGVENLNFLFSLYTIMWLLVADLSYRAICDALNKTWQFNLTDLFGRSLIFLGLILYGQLQISLSSPISYFIALSFVAYFSTLTIDIIWQRKHTAWGLPKIEVFYKYLPSITYLWFSALCIALFSTTDKLFLRYFSYSDEVINAYSNAYKIFETAAIIPGLTMPTIASLVKRKLDNEEVSKYSLKLQKIFKISLRKSLIVEWGSYIIFTALIICVIIQLASPFLIKIIDPDLKYPQVTAAAPILILTIVPMFLVFFFSLLTIFMSGEKYELYSTAIVLLVTVSLYLILIPRYGIYGASLATLLGFSMDMLTKMFFFLKVSQKFYQAKTT